MGHQHLRDPRQVRTERDVQPDRDPFEAVNGWIDTGSRDFDYDGSTRRRTLGPRGGNFPVESPPGERFECRCSGGARSRQPIKAAGHTPAHSLGRCDRRRYGC
jgi:hypothetical protein